MPQIRKLRKGKHREGVRVVISKLGQVALKGKIYGSGVGFPWEQGWVNYHKKEAPECDEDVGGRAGPALKRVFPCFFLLF